MSFLVQEESQESGQPIELFLLSNLEDRFAYTSAQEQLVFNTVTYVPRPIRRTEDRIESKSTKRSLTIVMPVTDPFVARYVATVPAQQDTLKVYKRHKNDGATPETLQIFSGIVTNVAIAKNEAQVLAISQASKLERTIPRQTCRNLCNHVLYNSRCKVDSSSFRIVNALVESISADGRTLTINAGSATVPFTGLQLSAQLVATPSFFTGGSVERASVERRMIRAITDLTGNRATISVLLPFATMSAGTLVTIFAGCDHKFTTCRDKFSNEENYGGFPYIPTKNPFSVGLTID